MSYPPIQSWIKYVILVASLVCWLCPRPALAQSPREGRIELALAGSDGSLIIQVSVPRGLTISNSTLRVDGQNIELKADPVAIPETYWFVLDASGNMLNTAPTVLSAVKRFLQNTPAERVGIVIYNNDIRILNPTRQSGEYSPFLDSYIAQANAVGCVGDAFNQLSRLALNPEAATRILLVAGELSRQGTCQTETLRFEQHPVDAILISDEDGDDYLDLIERNEGVLWKANLRTIESRFNEAKVQWSQPIYILRGKVDGLTGTNATLQINFSNAPAAQYDLRLLPYTPPESSTAAIATPSGSGLQGGASPTPILPTETPVIEVAVLVETPTETQETPIPDANTEPTIETEARNETSNEAPLATEASTETPVPIIETENTETENAETKSSDSILARVNPFLIVGGIGGLVLLLAAAFLLLRPSETRNPTIMLNPNIYESTYVVPQHTQPELTPYAKTEVINQSGLSAEDEALFTQVMTDDDFLTMRRQVGAHIVGLVKVHQNERLTGSYQLDKEGLTIGRNARNQIQINDARVSGNHAVLEVGEDGNVSIKAISQSNPVMVRGVKLTNQQSMNLASQDVIQLTPNVRLIYLGRDDAEQEGQDFKAPLAPKATLFDDGLTQL